MESVNVAVGERRIRATWTPELVQDLNAFQNIDVEDELTRLLTEQLTAEIDRNIIIPRNTIAQDLVNVQPMELPQGRLFYIEHPTVYDDGSWSLGNTFEGVIGIKIEIKPHTFI